MRHNLTNVAETQLDKVDSFYVVGSTTKDGLIEGRSNVKIDLKKAVAEGGGGSTEGLYSILEVFRAMQKGTSTYQPEGNTFYFPEAVVVYDDEQGAYREMTIQDIETVALPIFLYKSVDTVSETALYVVSNGAFDSWGPPHSTDEVLYNGETWYRVSNRG